MRRQTFRHLHRASSLTCCRLKTKGVHLSRVEHRKLTERDSTKDNAFVSSRLPSSHLGISSSSSRWRDASSRRLSTRWSLRCSLTTIHRRHSQLNRRANEIVFRNFMRWTDQQVGAKNIIFYSHWIRRLMGSNNGDSEFDENDTLGKYAEGTNRL